MSFFDKDFKEAISNLPSSEKDKLILRLLKKDLTLANRLYFELLSEENVEQKRDQLQKSLEKQAEKAVHFFYSPGYLSMDIRAMSGAITEHVKTTKDKFGDPWLNLFILNQIIPKVNQQLKTFSPRQAEKFYVPAIARVFKILLNMVKLHEDEQYEFREELERLGISITENEKFMKVAINHGLDVNWLIKFDIPENITEIHKELRENGFLR